MITQNQPIKKPPKYDIHNHVPDVCKVQAKITINNIKKSTINSQNTPNHIISNMQQARAHCAMLMGGEGSYPGWKCADFPERNSRNCF